MQRVPFAGAQGLLPGRVLYVAGATQGLAACVRAAAGHTISVQQHYIGWGVRQEPGGTLQDA